MTREEELAEIENFKKRIAEIESRIPPPAPKLPTEQEVREYQSQMHAAREARMTAAAQTFFTRDQLKAFEEACPTSVVKDIVAKGIPRPPCGAGSGGQIASVHRNAGLPGTVNNGWVNAAPLTPPPGIQHVDRVAAGFDRQDRTELAKKVAEQKLATRS
jgi:hypothetical protein